MGLSLADQVALLPPKEQEEILANLDLETLQWDWSFWGRPEQIPPDTDWEIYAYVAGRGSGKLVGLDTPILLADGTWSTMGDLKDGDYVFDENGNPTKVIQAHEPEIPKSAYRLTFSDGSQIEAGEEHLWVTWTHADRKSYNRSDGKGQKVFYDPTQGYPDDWVNWTRFNRWGQSTGVGPKVRTTQEIVDTFTYGGRNDRNHSIPLARPIQFPEAELPLHPRLLGLWLGGGHTKGNAISCHISESQGILELFEMEGFTASITKDRENTSSVRVLDFERILKELGVFGNKHIPRQYLISSEKQRRELLMGLLDSNGTIGKSGRVEFCSVIPQLAEDVEELVRGLGEKPTRKKDRCRISWRPKSDPFGLERKSEKFRPLGSQSSRHYHRMITVYEEIEPTLMRCITVDSPNSMYLVGRALIPTHNTRTAAEWVRDSAKVTSKGIQRFILVGRTAADVRDVMVEGESGIMNVHPPSEMPLFEPSKRRITWPNGNVALTVSADEPDLLRGPQAHKTWCDEMAAWRQIKDSAGLDSWANARIATRLGDQPQIMITTTPKRVENLKKILKEAEERPEKVLVARGSTADNVANLSRAYVDAIYGIYGGTKLAQQELEGIMLEAIDGALWSEVVLDDFRVNSVPVGNPLRVVGVDPTVAESPGDECGIVVACATGERDLYKRQAWVLEDATIQGSPDVWAKRAVDTAKKWGAPIVVEKNQGGTLVRNAISQIDGNIPVFDVWSKQGKKLRAEPISLAYQQGRIHHVGFLADLESQMVSWDPENDSKSPDRVDALVFALTALLVLPPKGFAGGSLVAKTPARYKIPSARVPSGSRSSGRRAAVFGAGIKKRR